jgi:hypothetical protein
VQEGILALANAIEPKGRNQEHASSAHEVRIALAAISNLLAPWDFRVVKCDRVHTSRLSTLQSSALPTIKRTWVCARAHP